MVSCWGLLSFIKASDERTYALKKTKAPISKRLAEDEAEDEGITKEELMEISRNVSRAKQEKSGSMDKASYTRRYRNAEEKRRVQK